MFGRRRYPSLVLGERWHSIYRDPDIKDTCVDHVLVLPDSMLTIWSDGTFARNVLHVTQDYLYGPGSMFDWHRAEDCRYV